MRSARLLLVVAVGVVLGRGLSAQPDLQRAVHTLLGRSIVQGVKIANGRLIAPAETQFVNCSIISDASMISVERSDR